MKPCSPNHVEVCWVRVLGVECQDERLILIYMYVNEDDSSVLFNLSRKSRRLQPTYKSNVHISGCKPMRL